MSDEHDPTQNAPIDCREDDVTDTDGLSEAMIKQINEGTERLARPPAALLVTGIMGSLEVGVGLLSEYIVTASTGSEMLGSLAFAIGLVIILLAHSELFTEGFLVPVSSVVAGKMPLHRLIRFWAITFAGNIIGAAVIMALLVVAYPDMHPHLIEEARHYALMPIDPQHVILAALGGMFLTLVTRMHQFTDEVVPMIIASTIGGFLLSATGIIHSILDTLFIFGGLFTGDSGLVFTDWLSFVWWVALANLIGGLGLVSALRFVQAGSVVREQKNGSSAAARGHTPEPAQR
ncbi:formate/nitrite transporter family protein [Corynebacterium sp. CCM 9185]|uniref:Formate/nitrite transporter family protein n=1 Tax=Corynebacterium marambiense TaxID=2765364 RepID=A0ABS0VWW6_9CORY|nr:formate/nitrite transporter family protein [Corynebacterium marambiense]MBI9000110.1 formate/nitrite transporter family protein [Corynebacterium marambiense]MCK7663464.1 formate/nitrite transporter family protein [Corynebacterium marambiense]